MSKSVVVTARIEEDLSRELNRLAAKLDRPRAWVVATAVERFVRHELEFFDSLDEAESQIDRGEFYAQDQMEAWLEERIRQRQVAAAAE